ncbi:MAG: ATP-dependent helicase HrpB [endosymbiont of Galathealinum brachiosum]|uniref:ATP-dependent helicase HrpB n=1 Tax=endosymbiont of Galathealinum brachiosum TaxID=2200906 RepID=A0A370DGM3_9GAMM|nr:MAG: ATP-dependent helicase HrpB [endosymbiont of Galathealinum brachiosum]
MQSLPINDVLDDIKNTLNTHNRVVLQAPPGAGKTTVVPVALLDQAWLENKQIIVLEPRRLAARNAAARMAFLLNESVGQTVGYQIRQDNCFSERTKILVVTEGILTRKLQADPEQENTALIIFDEFHERSLHADLSLALSLQSQQILNEDLKILIMSATLNTTAISILLDNAPIIQSEGRSYPVDIKYLDKPLSTAGNAYTRNQKLILQLIKTIKQVIFEQRGSCLVFLPGVKEINQLTRQIKQFIQEEKIDNIIVAPLHGSLSKQQQDQAISVPKNGFRKIVLATNIAETSLTIEGINCVVDSGLQRILEYIPSSAMNGLKTHFISEDSATQRCGRAGRLSEGVCYRIWTLQQQKRLLKHSQAEVLHSDLSSLVLELANWGVKEVGELEWLDVPPVSAIEPAKELLHLLKAIDSQGQITAHGSDMLKLGTHPRLAHMMLSSVDLLQVYHACLIAGLLTEKDLFKTGTDKSIDIHDRINVLKQIKSSSEFHHDVDKQQCKRIIQTADDFFSRLKRITNIQGRGEVDINLSGVLLAYAYPDRIAKQRRPDEAHYLLSNGKGAVIPEYLQHHLYQFLVIPNLDAMSGREKQGEANIYLAAEISEQQLDEYFTDLIEYKDTVQWSDTNQRVETKQSQFLGKLIIQEKQIVSEDKQSILLCLLNAVKVAGLDSLNWSSQASNLKQRIQFIKQFVKNDTDLREQHDINMLPDFSDEKLINELNIWLLPHLTNENSFKQIKKLNLYEILQSQLNWDQQQLVNKLAPEKIKVPSGSNVAIDYSDLNQPVLAVRLQEVFGLYETPLLLQGRCKLMMHLLSPARRPMQVTQDLKSFWQTTYHDVKKELRGKYKRHYWPDDPFTAQATNKTKKNMNK